jgi:hypothetical protein
MDKVRLVKIAATASDIRPIDRCTGLGLAEDPLKALDPAKDLWA